MLNFFHHFLKTNKQNENNYSFPKQKFSGKIGYIFLSEIYREVTEG